MEHKNRILKLNCRHIGNSQDFPKNVELCRTIAISLGKEGIKKIRLELKGKLMCRIIKNKITQN